MNLPNRLRRASITDDYWNAYIKHHSIWSRFSPEQRDQIFTMPIINHEASGYYQEPSIASIEIRPEIQKILKSIDCNPKLLDFHLLIRLMQICHAGGDLFAPDRNPYDLGKHLVTHVLSTEACCVFNANSHLNYYSYAAEISKVELELAHFNSRSRIRSFLALQDDENGMRWEADQRGSFSNYPNFIQFSGKTVCSYAREILNRLIAAPGPLALTEILDGLDFKKSQPSNVGKALRSICQYVFTIAAYDPASDGLILGLWPKLKILLDGNFAAPPPPPPPPVAQAPTTTFVQPSFCSDLATVIAYVAAKPIPLKQGRRLELYAADERKIAAQFEELPKWLGPGFFDTRIRATVASFAAARFEWLKIPRNELKLKDDPNGRIWLTHPPAKRLHLLLDKLRATRWSGRYEMGFTFTSVNGYVRRSSSEGDILACEDGIAAAFHHLSVDEWTDVNTWLDYAARVYNPIVATVGAETPVCVPKSDNWRGYTWVMREADTLEGEARIMLENFLFKRLLLLGGVELGLSNDKTMLFRINEIGRYYIGATKEFPVSLSSANGRVIVQPNFEIMILGSNMLAEADLTAFCERTGAKSGAVFRITRQSIQQALDKGTTADSILQTLRTLSDCELPANVTTEICGWSESRKTYATRAAILLVCPDATVAARVRGMLPTTTVVLNETTLELTTPLTTPQRRKLETAGIFKTR